MHVRRERKIGMEIKNKSCRRKVSDDNKSAKENAIKKIKMRANKKKMQRKLQANKLKCVRPIKQSHLTPTIKYTYSRDMVKIPLLLNI